MSVSAPEAACTACAALARANARLQESLDQALLALASAPREWEPYTAWWRWRWGPRCEVLRGRRDPRADWTDEQIAAYRERRRRVLPGGLG